MSIDKSIVREFIWEYIPGVTFFSIAHNKPGEAILGVGVNLSTGEITHRVEWETINWKQKDPLADRHEIRRKANQLYIGSAQKTGEEKHSSLVAVALDVPINLTEYITSGRIPETLRVALENAQSGTPRLGKPDIILEAVDRKHGCYINRGNCYSYAIAGAGKKVQTNPITCPGTAKSGGYEFTGQNITTSEVLRACLERDGLQKISESTLSADGNPPEKGGHYIIAAFFTPQHDFHFYRQEPHGTWTNRDNYLISDKDNDGEVITNPVHANRISQDSYSTFAGYYYVPNEGIHLEVPSTDINDVFSNESAVIGLNAKK